MAIVVSFFRRALLLFGFIALIMLFLSFSSIPFWAHYYLGVYGDEFKGNPEVIVILGGSGMPSSEGLMRTYYASFVAEEFKDIPIIIALPGDTLDSSSSVRLMARELIVRGVDSTRIVFENEGTNTRWEALNVKSRFFPNSSPRLLIVSSPSHMYRSVKTFRKVGFDQVGGIASFGRANETNLEFDAQALGGAEGMPDVGGSVSIRYAVWTRLHIQLTVIREYMAIAYYWMMGWI
jgi:uncharacterized SAM-binding protein YcdF (DUF218 family)